MDKDFHYYVTYTAALTAGWDEKEAKKIARSAQYVDDCVPGIREGTYKHNGNEYGYISTCCGTFRNIVMNKTARNAIWMPFHFLPGNFKCLDDGNREERNYLPYNGKRSGPLWNFQEESFKLLCIPKSFLAERMINDCMFYKDYWVYYDLIGICAHVMADTVSHAFYSGEAQWSSNEVQGDIYRVDHGVDKKIKFFYPLFEECSPSGPGYENVNYVGHGRAGHIPDYPHCDYKYQPQWNSQKKENVVYIKHSETYIFAFKLLVQALHCIKNNIEFEFDREFLSEYKCYGQDIIPILQKAFSFDAGLYKNYERGVEQRCDILKTELKDIGLDLSGENDYTPDEITKDDEASKSFNYAALRHFLMVRDILNNNGFDVFGEVAGIQEEHIVSQVLSKNTKFFGNEEEQYEVLSDEYEIFDIEEEESILSGEVDTSIDRFFYFLKDRDTNEKVKTVDTVYKKQITAKEKQLNETDYVNEPVT